MLGSTVEPMLGVVDGVFVGDFCGDLVGRLLLGVVVVTDEGY
jgi:hypothetical protein